MKRIKDKVYYQKVIKRCNSWCEFAKCMDIPFYWFIISYILCGFLYDLDKSYNLPLDKTYNIVGSIFLLILVTYLCNFVVVFVCYFVRNHCTKKIQSLSVVDNL